MWKNERREKKNPLNSVLDLDQLLYESVKGETAR